jgi:hypothetical protein
MDNASIHRTKRVRNLGDNAGVKLIQWFALNGVGITLIHTLSAHRLLCQDLHAKSQLQDIKVYELGQKDPEFLRYSVERTKLEMHLEKLNQGLRRLHEVERLQSEVLGRQHLDRLLAMRFIAEIYSKQEHPEKARPILLEILASLADVVGQEENIMVVR